MRYWIAVLAIAMISGAAGVLFLLGQNQPDAVVKISLTSAPFPLTVGTSTLLVSLTDGTGAPIEGATITVEGNLGHLGMLPMTGRGNTLVNEVYPVRITWSSADDWIIDVIAVLADETTVIREQFEVYVYAIPPFYDNPAARYRSVSENTEIVTANADREHWIIIAQGTQAVLRQGHGEDSEDILLKVDGQDTLVIRNDDIADHTVGPFFVRSGETIRQRFTEPAVFQGVCSISDNGSINIIVEG